MKIDLLCCLFAAFCLIGITATSEHLPNWDDYNIPEDRVNILNPLYEQFDGSDKIIRELMRKARHSEYMVAEYSALADFMIKNNMEYSSSAIIFAGNVESYEPKKGENYQLLVYILQQFPKSIQHFPVNMDQLLINLMYEKYLIKPSDNDVLVTKSNDYINYNQDTVSWKLKFDEALGSYKIQRDGEKWYATDAGMLQLVGEDLLSDGMDLWQFMPEPLLNDGEDDEQRLRYRIKNELRNECVCQIDDSTEIGNLLMQSCDRDNCLWTLDGSLSYFAEVTQEEGGDFFDLI